MKSYSLHKGLSWPVILLGLIVFVATILISPPVIFRSSPGGERTKALANVKSIMGGLLSFKPDYGAFPCDATRGELAKEEFINLPTSNSSNAYLTQLLVAESIDNPAPFAVPGTKFTKNNRWSKMISPQEQMALPTSWQPTVHS